MMNVGDTYTAMVRPGVGRPLKAEIWKIESPSEGEVVVRLLASSLNFHDLLAERGDIPASAYPRVPLSDGCGEVVLCGPGVDRFDVGDRVVNIPLPRWTSGRLTAYAKSIILGDQADGCLREYATFPESWLVNAPNHLTDIEAGVVCGAGLTAWRALAVEADVREGDTVLLQGTGGVSMFGLQIAKARGAVVVMLSSSDEKLDFAAGMGADHLINYGKEPDWVSSVMECTGGGGVDVVLDVVGPTTMPMSLMALADGGVVAVVGGLSGREPMALVGGLLCYKTARLVGIMAGTRDDAEQFMAELEARDMHPVVDHTIAMAEVSDAITAMGAGNHVGKIAVRISANST